MNISEVFRIGNGPQACCLILRWCWVLDLDIRGFLDAISREWLVKFIEFRITDRRVVRLIRKWMNAGALEDGKRVHIEEGTEGGSVIAAVGEYSTFITRLISGLSYGVVSRRTAM
jgi:hypothetical protein